MTTPSKVVRSHAVHDTSTLVDVLFADIRTEADRAFDGSTPPLAAVRRMWMVTVHQILVILAAAAAAAVSAVVAVACGSTASPQSWANFACADRVFPLAVMYSRRAFVSDRFCKP